LASVRVLLTENPRWAAIEPNRKLGCDETDG